MASTLVDDFDVVELLTLLAHRCVEMLDVAAAGLVELFEIQAVCPDRYRTGEPARHENLAADDSHWPRFGPVALETGFLSVQALPMRLRGVTTGALNLFRTEKGTLEGSERAAPAAPPYRMPSAFRNDLSAPTGLEISQRPQDLIPVHGNGATGVAAQTPLIFVTPIWQFPQYPVDRSGNGLFLAREPCGVLAPTRGRLHWGQCGNSVMRWAYDFP